VTPEEELHAWLCRRWTLKIVFLAMLQVDRMAGLALPNIFVQNYLKGLGHETGSNILTKVNSFLGLKKCAKHFYISLRPSIRPF
jgi:hypothetical protein